MLNSVGATSRVRMTPEDRRRQLVGIGLRKFVERPVQELSLDEVAAWVREGQEVRVQVDAYPGEAFEGRVTRIGKVVSAQSRAGVLVLGGTASRSHCPRIAFVMWSRSTIRWKREAPSNWTRVEGPAAVLHARLSGKSRLNPWWSAPAQLVLRRTVRLVSM